MSVLKRNASCASWIALLLVLVSSRSAAGQFVDLADLDAARRDRASLIQSLVAELKAEPSTVRKIEIVQLLGDIRADEAADVLVSLVTSGGLRASGVHPLRGYPAAIALSQLGQSANRAIFSRITRPVSVEELELFAYVLCSVDGLYEREYGLFLVQRASESKQVTVMEQNIVELKRIISSEEFGRRWPGSAEPGLDIDVRVKLE